MGSFGYICKGCNTHIAGEALVGGEKCILIHVRHGKELGRCEGHYDEFGRIAEHAGLPEDRIFRGDHNGINGHKEICASEFDFDDSFIGLVENTRVYNGQEIDFNTFVDIKQKGVSPREYFPQHVYKQAFNTLPIPKRDSYSATVAWHSLCYKKATPEQRNDLTPSKLDPRSIMG